MRSSCRTIGASRCVAVFFCYIIYANVNGSLMLYENCGDVELRGVSMCLAKPSFDRGAIKC